MTEREQMDAIVACAGEMTGWLKQARSATTDERERRCIARARGAFRRLRVMLACDEVAPEDCH